MQWIFEKFIFKFWNKSTKADLIIRYSKNKRLFRIILKCFILLFAVKFIVNVSGGDLCQEKAKIL